MSLQCGQETLNQFLFLCLFYFLSFFCWFRFRFPRLPITFLGYGACQLSVNVAIYFYWSITSHFPMKHFPGMRYKLLLCTVIFCRFMKHRLIVSLLISIFHQLTCKVHIFLQRLMAHNIDCDKR